MFFPKWVEAPKNKDQKASNRLRFLILTLALHHGSRPTLRSFGTDLGINHTLLWKYIDAGSFSRPLAALIIKTTGTKLITADDLVYPLEITADKIPA